MKKILSIFASAIISLTAFAQSPQSMSYQAVIRNASNTLVASSPVGMRISILQGSSSGTAVYVETQTPTTNANGLVSIAIGAGTVTTGTFSAINWAAGPYFVKTETDPTGGTSYSITGTSQLLSVPYALYAANAINYNAGTGISITSGTISSTAPTQITGASTAASTPVTISGSGFTTTRIGMGYYQVTFTTPFISKPTVVAGLYYNNFSDAATSIVEFLKITNVTTTGFLLYLYNNSGSVDYLGFSFIATGN